ncbi:TetR/AcrR family transcriptional regulator [Lacticaseibacillus pantheris]|jgi:AcrR family transcriptional regulator|uniref:Transcription regulator n=1 Tax=Lacticaseibacillus pantheris DSM 15945 = JCM 12539 = NBRC 106106 TaxID=1423783 RepID=A0A0R1U0L4_9LACO|nr:TetR/AcrR family transcriptional regulator [Lacticaseibacillus pantheris]KRL84696.1 transcription regulator [Lacticaseibacillus pantheris DSM 15945 = JCM 12539 = NBRC 106106]WKF83944.1 TetR/AcrR family transcriptional regulator [Lacticaseibacillus pantheris]
MSATKHAQQIREDSINYLTTALLQLLEKKPLAEIKVTELVARAGVSRMAYYRNFDTLEDILRAYFAPRISHLFDDVIERVPTDAKIADMQQFFEEMGAALSLAERRNYEYIIQRLFDGNMRRFYDNNRHWDGLDPTAKRYWAKFMSAGVYGIWREWLLHGQQERLADIHLLVGTMQDATSAALGSVDLHNNARMPISPNERED